MVSKNTNKVDESVNSVVVFNDDDDDDDADDFNCVCNICENCVLSK